EHPMSQHNDLSRSLTSPEQDSTIIAVIEMSQSSWLVAGIVPGIERHPLKKIEPSEEELTDALACGSNQTWPHDHAHRRRVRSWPGRFLAGALVTGPRHRNLRHPSDERGSIARASPGENSSTRHWMLKRVFIGWLRGEPDHCHMAAIPTLAEEDATRPNRERERLVRERTRIVN